MTDTLQSMFDSLARGDEVYRPSQYWEALNTQNVQELALHGLDNIKRTIAQNYFTWVVGHRDRQFRYLARHTQLRDWRSIISGSLGFDPTIPLSRRRQFEHQVFTKMLWHFVERLDAGRERLLDRIGEPLIGNPFRITVNGRIASQDLANSVLEYYSIREHFQPLPAEKPTICELGAGYGRNAYVFLNALPRCRYVVIDIPPALYVSQRYLTSVLPERRIMPFSPWDKFSQVEREFEAADVAFLLPHQAALLPEKSADLFVNISSLHEMTKLQIATYLKLIDRLTAGLFYSKQWLVSRNPADNIVVRAEDYPIPLDWKCLYHRRPRVQTHFFEALYAIAGGTSRP